MGINNLIPHVKCLKGITAILLIQLILLSSVTSFGQQARPVTLWGPGKGYRITYLHSGKLIKNGTTNPPALEFENAPTTEFRLDDITDNAYSFTYTGYGDIQLVSNITMENINIPNLGG